MSRFQVTPTKLSGLLVVTRERLSDRRGFLSRLFCADELAHAGWVSPIAQINHTLTTRAGTVRGMHYQTPPHAEMKLVTCLRGEVFDVAVDLRRGSPTFLQWHGERLSSENNRALLIPEGFAHGFQALTDAVELLYCHSTPYQPHAEAGLHPNDPRLSIAWPQEIADLSPRDGGHPVLTPDFRGVDV